MEKVVVVGTNHAGTHAVSTLTEYYKDSVEVVTYDTGKHISFLGCGMALWIGNVIDTGDGLFYASPEGLREAGAEVLMEHEMINADFDNKVVTIRNNQTGETFDETYDKLILGIGSWPILPELPGHDLENIVYAKIFENAEHVIELLKNPDIKRVAVVGAGYIGVELAEAFKENGKEIVLINNFNVLNRYYDEEFQEKMAQNLRDNGIECHLDELVTEFVGTDGKVSGLKTTNGEYDVQLVLMSVGFRPRTEFLNGMVDMLPNGAIITNNKQETSVKDVYAIGDCTTVYSNATQSIEHIALATNAVRTGIVAAHNAAGTPVEMLGVQGSNAISIYGLNLCSTGMTEAVAIEKGFNVQTVTVEDTLKPAFMPENDDVKLKIVWDADNLRILGAQMESRADVSLALHSFSLMIQEGYTIDKLALLDLFFLPHFNQPHNFITKAGLQALDMLLKK